MKANETLWMNEEDFIDDDRPLTSKGAKIVLNENIQQYAEEFEWEIEKEDDSIKVIGSEWDISIGHSKKGTFKITLIKTDSTIIELGFAKFEIISSVNAGKYGAEKLRFKNCRLDKVGSSVKAGEIIKETYEGKFFGFEPLDLIQK